MGVTEPEATFSACFGGAFLMWHPMKYAAMLAAKMEQHGTSAWLVNTGCAAHACPLHPCGGSGCYWIMFMGGITAGDLEA